MEEKFQFKSKSKIYPISPIFKHLVDISPKVSTSLIFTSNHCYQVESQVSDKTFESFLKFLIDDELTKIQIDNIHEYINLSQEFQILNEFVESKINEFGECCAYVIIIQTNKNTDLTVYEEKIALKLDEYLEKNGKELLKSPIHSLFNIFNHEKRQLTNHNLAYDLIKHHFDQTNDPSIFVLLNSLEASKLSKSNFEESFIHRESRMGNMPKLDFSYLSNLFKKQQEFEELFNQHTKKNEKENQKIESNQNKLAEEMQNKYSEVIRILNEKINSLSKQIEDLRNQNIKEMSEKIQKLEASNSELNTKIKKLEDSNNDLSTRIQSMKSQFDEKNKEYRKTLEFHKYEFSGIYKHFQILSLDLDINTLIPSLFDFFPFNFFNVRKKRLLMPCLFIAC